MAGIEMKFVGRGDEVRDLHVSRETSGHAHRRKNFGQFNVSRETLEISTDPRRVR
jgi:hypothetical protein